jgi:hypothetical protein
MFMFIDDVTVYINNPRIERYWCAMQFAIQSGAMQFAIQSGFADFGVENA